MFRTNLSQWINLTYLDYFKLSIASLAFVSGGIPFLFQGYSSCSFCLAVRFIFGLIAGLSIGARLIPAHRFITYPMEIAYSAIGLLLSMRQLYFENTAQRLIPCVKMSQNVFKVIFSWLYAGAPACQKTPTLELLAGLPGWTAAAWAVLAFTVLLFSSSWLYFKRVYNK